MLSCSVSQKPSRQDPPTGPQSGDSLWMGVLCVPMGVLDGLVVCAYRGVGWVCCAYIHQHVVCG